MTKQSLQKINKLFKQLNTIKTHIKHRIKLSFKKNSIKHKTNKIIKKGGKRKKKRMQRKKNKQLIQIVNSNC